MSEYVNIIKDKKDTDFRAWALLCAREMGPLVRFKEEDFDFQIPEEILPSTHYIERMTSLKTQISEIESMSPDDALRMVQAEHGNEIAKLKIEMALKAKLVDMYHAVLEWQPPTPEHQPLKQFMMYQLESEFVDPPSSRFEERLEILRSKQISGEDWRRDKLLVLKKDFEYSEKAHECEVQRATWATNWIRLLRTSLNDKV